MNIQPYELAFEEWTTDAGGQNLIALWNSGSAKAHEEAVAGSLLAMFCGDAKRVVDLGCGPARFVPVVREYLPKLVSYAGWDISERLLAEATANYGGEAGITIEERDIFKGAPYSKARRPDVLLSIDTSRHYKDPMALLKTIVETWPARAYVFSVLYGQPAELINGQVVSLEAMEQGLAECGEVLGYQEIVLEPGMAVRYVVVKGA